MRVLFLGGPYHGDIQVVPDGSHRVNYIESPPFSALGLTNLPADSPIICDVKSYRVDRLRLAFGSGPTYHGNIYCAETMTPAERSALTFRTLVAPQYQGVFEKW